MGFMITTDGIRGSTQIPNDIITEYLLDSRGEHIRVYLYLLMAGQHPGITGPISVSSLADAMDLTEKDIVRSLRYWERQGLLMLSGEGDLIDGIALTDPDFSDRGHGSRQASISGPDDGYAFEHADNISRIGADDDYMPDGTPRLRVLRSENTSVAQPITGTGAHETGAWVSGSGAGAPGSGIGSATDGLPARTEYTPGQIDALAKDKEMKKTLKSVEKALGATIAPSHMQLVMYMLCDLGFSGEMITYLYELGAERKKTNPRYLETIAVDWAGKGIHTVEDAKAESDGYKNKYLSVKKALGIRRDFAPVEKDIIDSWDTYHFSEDIIIEACRRTVLQTGDTNLNYVSKILEGWKNQGVTNLQDIAAADEAYKNSKKAAAKNNVTRRRSSGSFRNFHGRDYSDEDYEDLERQFLQRKGAP
ncbi:MAG: DnaD domain protein [Eubacterium sp.]|nr:DnaD domain protein [Eubacterium sp.]